MSVEGNQETKLRVVRPFARPYLVAVEGNIGCGKSTFMEWCRTLSDIEAVSEPVLRWTDVNGVNLLVRYENEKTTAFENKFTIFMPW